MNDSSAPDPMDSLLGPAFRARVGAVELTAAEPAERLASLLALADAHRCWCIVHRHVHEVRSPLNALSLSAQLLDIGTRSGEEVEPEQIASILGAIGRLTEALEALVRAVQAEPCRTESFDLVALAREAAELAAPALEATGARAVLDGEPGPVQVQGDPTWTRHAILHVLLASDSADGEIRVRTSAHPREGRVTIEPADVGGQGGASEPVRDIAQPLLRAQGGRLDRRAAEGSSRVELALPSAERARAGSNDPA